MIEEFELNDDGHIIPNSQDNIELALFSLFGSMDLPEPTDRACEQIVLAINRQHPFHPAVRDVKTLLRLKAREATNIATTLDRVEQESYRGIS